MRTVLGALACALTLSLWGAGGAGAADLSIGPTYNCDPAKPTYYGEFEPWSRRQERPPRRGRWYYSSPRPPAVNFLVPMREGLCLRPTPWTPAWFAYCEQRWPSFNPNTGTIRTADGVRMCI